MAFQEARQRRYASVGVQPTKVVYGKVLKTGRPAGIDGQARGYESSTHASCED